MSSELSDGLNGTEMERCFQRHLAGSGRTDITLTQLVRLPQGHSNDTLLAKAVSTIGGKRAEERFVIRRDIVHGISEPYDIPKEYRLLKALAATEVAAPPVYWSEDAPSSLDVAYYVMGFCDGDLADELYGSGDYSGVIGRASPAERRAIHTAYFEELAKIHRVDWRALGLGEMSQPMGFDFQGVPIDGTTDAARRALVEWEGRTRRELLRPAPLLEEPLAWLRENLPLCPRNVLLHGDCKLSNYMFKDGSVSGVLDWEWSRIGDPMNDLAWCLPAPGADLPDGFLDFDGAVAVYERASGNQVDPARLDFYRGITGLKVCAFTAAMGRLIELGQSHDIRYGCLNSAFGYASINALSAEYAPRLG